MERKIDRAQLNSIFWESE